MLWSFTDLAYNLGWTKWRLLLLPWPQVLPMRQDMQQHLHAKVYANRHKSMPKGQWVQLHTQICILTRCQDILKVWAIYSSMAMWASAKAWVSIPESRKLETGICAFNLKKKSFLSLALLLTKDISDSLIYHLPIQVVNWYEVAVWSGWYAVVASWLDWPSHKHISSYLGAESWIDLKWHFPRQPHCLKLTTEIKLFYLSLWSMEIF